MQRKNKVFFTLSLIFLVLALICTVFALVFGAELRGIGQADNGDTGSAGNAIGAAAAGIFLAFFLVVSSVAAWGFSALSILFSALNLRIRILWLRVTSAVFLGSAVLFSVVTAISLLTRVG